MDLAEALRSSLGFEVVRTERLAGGCVGDVVAVTSADGAKLVAKLDPSGSSGLEVEARMLRDLAAVKAPAPRVRLARPGLLVMGFVEGRTGARGKAEEHLADVLADLHAAPLADARFGYDYDTRIGGLVQPNPRSSHWLPFFAEHRLVHMAREARNVGRLT
ncbi:MAG: fructosamine kinase family protein, partial [Planctomycetes bacterium]|nr:fructosamine kinase family protein [Planctomycetota bacterium]